MKRNLKGLVKFAQQLSIDTFDPTPTSPTLFRNPTLYSPIDEEKHLEAVTMSSPRQFYGMTLGPITAAGAITAAPTLIPLARSTAGNALSRAKKIIPLVGHVAAGLGKEVGKTVWTGGQNLIEDESPIVSTLGQAYRAVTNVGPVVWYLKNKYNVTSDVLKNLMTRARTLAQNAVKKNVNP